MPSNYLILCCHFSSCLQSFPASRSFPMSQFFTSGGQIIGASASASVLPMHIQDWFILGLTGLISLQIDQITNIRWIIEKAREFQKHIYFCFIDYTKAFVCVDHNKMWKILKEMGIPDHLTCLLRNLYTGQEATVRTRHGAMDWFQIGRGVHQGCIL